MIQATNKFVSVIITFLQSHSQALIFKQLIQKIGLQMII